MKILKDGIYYMKEKQYCLSQNSYFNRWTFPGSLLIWLLVVKLPVSIWLHVVWCKWKIPFLNPFQNKLGLNNPIDQVKTSSKGSLSKHSQNASGSSCPPHHSNARREKYTQGLGTLTWVVPSHLQNTFRVEVKKFSFEVSQFDCNLCFLLISCVT